MQGPIQHIFFPNKWLLLQVLHFTVPEEREVYYYYELVAFLIAI